MRWLLWALLIVGLLLLLSPLLVAVGAAAQGLIWTIIGIGVVALIIWAVSRSRKHAEPATTPKP
jgi:hypothetical protein